MRVENFIEDVKCENDVQKGKKKFLNPVGTSIKDLIAQKPSNWRIKHESRCQIINNPNLI